MAKGPSGTEVTGMDRVLRPVALTAPHLVARRHVDLARVNSALCS